MKKGRVEEGKDPFFISGSVVTEGTGTILVTAVGVHSFQGKTLLSLQTPDEVTPLQEKLEVIATHILFPLIFFSFMSIYFLLLVVRIGYAGLFAAVLMLLVVIPKYFITKCMFTFALLTELYLILFISGDQS